MIDDTELFNNRLQNGEDFYNFNRPHGGLGGQTPYDSGAALLLTLWGLRSGRFTIIRCWSRVGSCPFDLLG